MNNFFFYTLLKIDNFAWSDQDVQGLQTALGELILRNKNIERGSWSGSTSAKLRPFQEEDCVSDTDKSFVKIVKKVASESCGNM